MHFRVAPVPAPGRRVHSLQNTLMLLMADSSLLQCSLEAFKACEGSESRGPITALQACGNCLTSTRQSQHCCVTQSSLFRLYLGSVSTLYHFDCCTSCTARP